MFYSLTVIKSPEGVNVSDLTRSFPDVDISIGRGANNDWVLDDVDRFLSSCHCRISAVSGEYFLTDLSTNGTFFKGSHEPIGRGERVSISSGDTFDMGDYCFQFTGSDVNGANKVSNAGASPFDEPAVDDLFAQQSDDFSVPSTTSTANPFADSGVNIQDGFSLSSVPEVSDPLAALDGAGAQQSDPFASDGFGSAHQGGFGIPSNNDFPSEPASYGDGSDALNQSVSWPSASEQNLIPEDWDGDLWDADDVPVNTPNAVFSAAPVVEPAPTPREPKVPLPKIPAAKVRDDDSRLTPKHRPEVRDAIKENVSRARTASPDMCFIDALGLDKSGLSDEQVVEVSKLAGELMREVTEGMMQLLRARTNIKNEFRMNVTTIQPAENNPLKFSVGVDDAIENMFVRKNSAYKEPIQAFREGFQGVAEHQVAIIAGIRFAFEGMMDRFNPDNLEKMFNKGKKGAVIPSMQKAKNWNVYTDYYSSLVNDMERSFQHLFGDNFVQAYEDQLRRLVAERKKK